jgi:TatA/E family protein of Tat protein translocase
MGASSGRGPVFIERKACLVERLVDLLIIFAIAMLISGPSKLVGLGKSLRQGIRGFKSAMKGAEPGERKK